MIPAKLQKGDEIRIVAPSRSLDIIGAKERERATRRLEALGFHVSFGRHVQERDLFDSSSIEHRVADLHDAFSDPKVKAILTVIGGFNSNQLLRYLDYELIRQNPKILCGYSDITALANAIYAKTGMITYSGPHFSTFGMEKGFDYILDYFQRCLMSEEPIELATSSAWSDDAWYFDQENRTFIPNEGYLAIQEGEGEGTIIGGNLCTLNLLQGTEYMPSLAGAILFLEDDYVVDAPTFDRDLQSLLHQPGFSEVKGIVIGRFQQESNMTQEKLLQIIATKQELRGIPVLAQADFGHTTPMFTFPIGGSASLSVKKSGSSLMIHKH
ncbi:S66 family peptidase [Brevibacillus migulae]|uniref:S66 family peptidase n=1 Tax=Brevibacillus migulae TaxID=1644114 RepID=UPI00106E39AC|nr:S66 peptidase family protein [Brevibacillus migulae]